MKSTQDRKFSPTMQIALDVIDAMTPKEKKNYAKSITVDALMKARKKAGLE